MLTNFWNFVEKQTENSVLNCNEMSWFSFCRKSFRLENTQQKQKGTTRHCLHLATECMLRAVWTILAGYSHFPSTVCVHCTSLSLVRSLSLSDAHDVIRPNDILWRSLCSIYVTTSRHIWQPKIWQILIHICLCSRLHVPNGIESQKSEQAERMANVADFGPRNDFYKP